MKWVVIFLGIALILIGILSLAYHGIPYTTREKVVVIGPLQTTAEVRRTIPLSPIWGGRSLRLESSW